MAVQNNPELYQLVYDYLLPQFFLGVLVILVNGTCAYIRSDGIRKLAMYVPILVNAVNLLFDYIFIGVMGYGIMSAAWATNVGYFAGFLLVLRYFYSEARSVHFAPVSLGDIKLIFEACSNGMATALSHLTIFIRTAAMNTVILAAGSSSGMQILSVCISGYNFADIFYMGTSQTILPIGGALYDEKDYNALRSLSMTGIRINFWICTVLLVLFEVFPNEMALVFGLKDPSGMPIFEQAIAYFGGWNIKAYLICQDKAQLDAAYGKDESITSNCHVTVAYAPNKVETAKYLSDRLGVTTVIKEQESISFQGGTGIFAKKSVTKSQQEVQRAVLTPDEIMRLPGPVKDIDNNITEPCDMLVFAAGFPPVYRKQILYFLDETFSERSKIDAPDKSDIMTNKL